MTEFVSDTIDINQSFWELNPQLKFISDFKELYDADTTKDKSYSSKQMWGVLLYSDAARSKIYSLPEKEKKQEIVDNVLTGKHDFNDLKKAIEAYPKHCMSKKQRLFKSWGDKLEERETFLLSKKYNEATWEMLDKMMKATEDLFDTYTRVEKEMIDESKKGRVKGGREESLSEQHEI